MIDWDKWQEILNSLRRQKLRTLLTAFGVFWGIFMLVILLGFGTGFGINIDTQYGNVKNVIWVWPSSKTQIPYEGLGKGRNINITQDDVNVLRENLSNVEIVEGVNQINGQLAVHEKESGSFTLLGTHANWQGLDTLRVIEGRYINKNDEMEMRKVAVIGTRVRDVLFKGKKDVLGKTIYVNGIYFKVVGIYKSTQPDNPFQSTGIYIPNDTLRNAFNSKDGFSFLLYQPREGHGGGAAVKEIKNLLQERKKIHPDDKGVIGTYDNSEDYKQDKNLVRGIIGFSWIVAIGTIIAGAIGIGNIMLVIVKERTREIGLRKALGATPMRISVLIMQEALLITVVAGYTGLAAGVFLLEAIKLIFIKLGHADSRFSQPFVDLNIALIALFVLVTVAVMAALVPAVKAASVNPIVALQDE
ncbi:MAG: ABC transporter permease [Gammaproteobacteria bacterium]|nr:MAG: ABC transporter permease [Gammaproteobacteria bacterium]